MTNTAFQSTENVLTFAQLETQQPPSAAKLINRPKTHRAL